MTVALSWEPFFSPLPVVAFAVGLIVLAILAYVPSFSLRPAVSVALLVMRVALIVGLTTLLMGPSIIPAQREAPGRPTLPIMIDTSGSMRVQDMHEQARYAFLAEHWLDDKTLERLQREYRIELIGFDSAPRPLPPQRLRESAARVATGDEANIVGSVYDVVARTNPDDAGGSVLVFSDGNDTRGTPVTPLAQFARSRSLPIHTVPLGGPHLQRDLALVAEPEQDYLLAGERGTIQVEALQTNADHARTRLHLRSDNNTQTREVVFDGRSRLAFEFPVTEQEPGLYAYEIELEPLEDELETRNNHQTVFIEVTDHRLQVLLIEGQPYWDTRFIAQSLRGDEHVALTQVTQVALAQQHRIITRADGDRTLPETIEDYASFDVIVIGRGIENILSEEQLEMLPQYVADHGGRVIFARGRAYETDAAAGRTASRVLSPIEPVVWGQGRLHNQQLVLDAEGRKHPSFTAIQQLTDQDLDHLLSSLPALRSVFEIVRPKTSARVLAGARPAGGGGAAHTQPALVTMPYGRGRVAAIVGEGMWRWRLHEQREDDAVQGLFDRFWSNMIRWLAMGSDFQPGQEISVRLGSSSVRVGHPLDIELLARVPLPPGQRATLTIIDPQDEAYEIVLDTGPGSTRQQFRYEPENAGVYRIVAQAGPLTPEPVETRFSAYDVDMQMLDAAANPGLLRAMSEGSGGRFLDPDAPEELFDVLEGHLAATLVPPRPEPAWNTAWIMLLVLAWAGGEWMMRKKGGLL